MNENIDVIHHKRRIQKRKPFALIGNEIDGRLSCPHNYNFKSFTDLRKRLPVILESIKGEGEWTFDLYQVPKDYKIWHRWGYFKYPNRGVKLFTYSYMNLPIKAVEFYKREVSFVGTRMGGYSSSNDKLEIEISRLILEYRS